MSTHDVSGASYDCLSGEVANRNRVGRGESTDQQYKDWNFSSNHLKRTEESGLELASTGEPDLVCFSHLRWNFVYQRPQHLLSRCVLSRRVFFVEEPIVSPDGSWHMSVKQQECGVWVVVPYLPKEISEKSAIALQKLLINAFLDDFRIRIPILWYYTPMAVPFTSHLEASAVIYDCMDELSAFKGSHPELQKREAELLKLADLVFTGGRSLYEAKQNQHSNIHAFPSSINAADFAQARCSVDEPRDQASIPHPRLGFYGVIDERMDLALLNGVSRARPDWQLVIIGPVAKIDPTLLPQYPNVHYLGSKSYQELPKYLAGWDVALLPFAHNDSTRFISPTKTPEYLAAGRPVVSTSIKDVVRPYGENGLVHIADTVPDFISAISAALNQTQDNSGWLDRVDSFLSNTSWDRTWQAMNQLIEDVVARRAEQDKELSRQQNSRITNKHPISTDTRSNKLKI
jgi:glycosyltransferase involved in cell wall biosynthesis